MVKRESEGKRNTISYFVEYAMSLGSCGVSSELVTQCKKLIVKIFLGSTNQWYHGSRQFFCGHIAIAMRNSPHSALSTNRYTSHNRLALGIPLFHNDRLH